MDNELFKFNLLPRQSQAELELYEERDNTIFYAVLIVFFGSIVWVISSFLANQIVLPRLTTAQGQLVELNKTIENAQTIRERHGELVMKAQSLKPLLEKSIDTELIFQVATELISGTDSTAIASYERESSGRFVFRVISKDFNGITQLMDNARTIENIDNVELKSSTYNTVTDTVTNSIAVNIQGVGGQ